MMYICITKHNTMQTMYAFRLHAEVIDAKMAEYIYTPITEIFEISREDYLADPASDLYDENGNGQPCTLWAYDDYYTAVLAKRKAYENIEHVNA